MTTSCCGRSTTHSSIENKNNFTKFLDRIYPHVQLAYRVSVAAIAAFINFKLFAIAGSIGALMGIGFAAYNIYHGEVSQIGKATPSCGIGFFEGLSGHALHKTIGDVATAIFIAIHFESCQLYIPFCMLPLGFFAGEKLANAAWHLQSRDISPIFGLK